MKNLILGGYPDAGSAAGVHSFIAMTMVYCIFETCGGDRGSTSFPGSLRERAEMTSFASDASADLAACWHDSAVSQASRSSSLPRSGSEENEIRKAVVRRSIETEVDCDSKRKVRPLLEPMT